MSCHNIGRGMNYVVKNVIKMYDTGELTLEAVSYTHLDVYKRQGLQSPMSMTLLGGRAEFIIEVVWKCVMSMTVWTVWNR